MSVHPVQFGVLDRIGGEVVTIPTKRPHEGLL